MNKYAYLLAAALFAPAAGASAADSVVTISGSLRNKPCSVSGKSVDFNVPLQEANTRQFTKVGAASAMTSFYIVLEMCGQGPGEVRIGFSGKADGLNGQLLQNEDGDAMAGGVGIQILNEKREAVPLNAPLSSLSWLPLTAGATSQNLTFYARLMSTQPSVTAGHVSASANFILEFQ